MPLLFFVGGVVDIKAQQHEQDDDNNNISLANSCANEYALSASLSHNTSDAQWDVYYARRIIHSIGNQDVLM